MIDKEQGRRLKELLAKATPGPLTAYVDETVKIRDALGVVCDMRHLYASPVNGSYRRNAQSVADLSRLIVEAINALPALLDEAEQWNKAEAMIDKIRYACDPESERIYVAELLEMFDPESGKVKTGGDDDF